jgi:hypothetical protein
MKHPWLRKLSPCLLSAALVSSACGSAPEGEAAISDAITRAECREMHDDNRAGCKADWPKGSAERKGCLQWADQEYSRCLSLADQPVPSAPAQ